MENIRSMKKTLKFEISFSLPMRKEETIYNPSVQDFIAILKDVTKNNCFAVKHQDYNDHVFPRNVKIKRSQE
jgi:hypothetical protein